MWHRGWRPVFNAQELSDLWSNNIIVSEYDSFGSTKANYARWRISQRVRTPLWSDWVTNRVSVQWPLVRAPERLYGPLRPEFRQSKWWRLVPNKGSHRHTYCKPWISQRTEPKSRAWFLMLRIWKVHWRWECVLGLRMIEMDNGRSIWDWWVCLFIQPW